MSKKTKRTAAPRHITQPRDLDRWLDRAASQLVAGDYAGAIVTAQRVLQAPIASREQRAEAYDRLGAAHMMLQQFDDAYAVVSAALELSPDDAMLWYNRGMAARYTTRMGQSLRDFERAAELDVDGVLTDKIAQEIEFTRPLVAQALALRGPHVTLDQLIAQEELFQQAAQLMQQQRWREAEQDFRQVIALGDVLPQPWGNLGLCLLMQRQFDAAEAALRRALEIDPSYTIARQNLAGLPAIRATGKLPAMRVSTPFEGRNVKRSLTFLMQDDGER
jgi:tetratricopeptide (TPR) repeat protein